jgi:hypothetical protein
MRKTLLVASAAAVVGYCAYRWQAADEVTPAADELVQNRLWADHLPAHERDRVHVFAALDHPVGAPRRGPVGVFELIGPWEGHFEAFRYEREGEEMRILFPQSGDKETLRVKAWECSERRGMDYCLEVSGNSRGVQRYYSRKGWEVRTVADVEALSQSLAP